MECSFPDIQDQAIFHLFLSGAQLCLQPRRDNSASIMAGCSHPSRSPTFFQKNFSVSPFLFRINYSWVAIVETVLIVCSNKQLNVLNDVVLFPFRFHMYVIT